MTNIGENLAAWMTRTFRVGPQSLGVTPSLSDGSNYYDEATIYQGHPAPQKAYAVIGNGFVTQTGAAYVTVVEENLGRIGGVTICNPLSVGGWDVFLSFNDESLGANGLLLKKGTVREIQTTAKIRAYVPASAGPMNISYVELGVE